MLPLVDKPAIQYVVEEAVRVGHHRHPHHHRPGQAQPRGPLRPVVRARVLTWSRAASTTSWKQMRAIADMADIHYVRQGEPKGLGHAVSVAREHVGDQPFVVMLGDDIMHERAGVLDGMLAAHERTGASVVALKEVAPAGDLQLRLRHAGAGRGQPGPDPRHRREAGARGGAVQPGRDGPLRVHPGHLRRPRPGQAGQGRRDPADRRHQGAAGRPRPSTAGPSGRAASTSATSSTTSGPPSSWPSSATTSGPAFRAYLVELAQREHLGVIPLAEAQGPGPRRLPAARRPARSPSTTPWAA